MKRIIISLFLLPVFAGTTAAAEPPLILKDLLARARQANPEITQARETWRVANAQIAPAGTWPNPTFTYIDEDFASGMAGVPPETIHHYRLEQPIPFPGKPGVEAQMKHHEALISEENYRARLLEVQSDVRMRYYQLYLTDEKINLAKDSVNLMNSALKVAQARLASNQTSASDVFMAQTELRKMENNLFEQEQERILLQVELNTLLNNPTDTPLGPAQPPRIAEVPVPLNDLQTLARRYDPLYLSALHEVNHSRAMMKRSRLQFAPDLGFLYEKEVTPVGPPGQQIGFSVTFPLWLKRPWAEYQGAKEHILEAGAGSAAMENMVRKMVHHEFTETHTHLTLTQNYLENILPLTLSNLKIVRRQYENGRGDFLRLLEAFRSWIETHNEYQEHLYEYGEHWSALERWVGVDLTQAKALLEKQDSLEKKHEH
jgi:cobalt-zinc-cadmium efflux system outer membrane protein